MCHTDVPLGQLSSKQQLLFGVQQGSVLGPLLHLLYTAKLEQLILRHGLHIRQYADDSQVYMSVSVSEVRTAVHSFAVCIHDVNEWMRASRLRLNPTKTQVMWLGSSHQLKHVDLYDTHCCRPLSRSLRARATSELFWTAGGHSRHTSQRSVGPGTIPAPTTTPACPIDDGGSC